MIWLWMFWFYFSSIAVDAEVTVIPIDPATINRTSCIPIVGLHDAMVQRGLGESRKIRQIQLHMSGAGFIDMDVSLATEFQNGDDNAPILHSCGHYLGGIGDVLIDIDCIEPQIDPEGYSGLAVYVKFNGDVSQSLSICQIDIFVHDKNAPQKREIIHATVVITSILCAVMIMVAIGVVAWYTCTHLLTGEGGGLSDDDTYPEGTEVDYLEEKKLVATNPSESVDLTGDFLTDSGDNLDSVFESACLSTTSGDKIGPKRQAIHTEIH